MKHVILLGKGALAVKVADWFLASPDYQLVRVVPNMPESPGFPSLRSWAIEHQIPWVETGKTDDIPGIHEEGASIDLAVSVTYDKIIKEWFIKKCHKIINIHNGPLPQYRGVNPVNWALKNGEREHGVTMHDITPGIDDGPIVSQIFFPVNPEVDEVVDVYERCLHFGWKLFKETMPTLWETIPQAQDESHARYYSKKDFSGLGERSFFTRQESRAKQQETNTH
ncbi:formyl transferase [Candidatus Uhrbacteria bacterium]|nr:formyl transferase [Candidatus Uhrbacteria bacterium]